MESFERELADEQRAEREAADRKLTVREVAAEWLEWLSEVRGAKPSTVQDYEFLLHEPGIPYKRGDARHPPATQSHPALRDPAIASVADGLAQSASPSEAMDRPSRSGADDSLATCRFCGVVNGGWWQMRDGLVVSTGPETRR